jgi:hypothetical protein
MGGRAFFEAMTRRNYLQFGLTFTIVLAIYLLNPIKVRVAVCIGHVKCANFSSTLGYCDSSLGWHTEGGCGYAGSPPICGVETDCDDPTCNVGNTCYEVGGGTPTPTPS